MLRAKAVFPFTTAPIDALPGSSDADSVSAPTMSAAMSSVGNGRCMRFMVVPCNYILRSSLTIKEAVRMNRTLMMRALFPNS